METVTKYNYKLEEHLKQLSDNNEDYTNLYSSWAMNKTTYTNLLSTIHINYPHYSLHDASHSESIITNIEMLLGEKQIKKLSPTDTWLILNCAYLHDFGMVLLHSNIEEEWETESFQEYLHTILESTDDDLRDAAGYVLGLQESFNNESVKLSWPIKIRKYVTEIIAAYFRGNHSSMTRQYLNKLDTWNIDLTQNGLIHNRLIKLIGEISFLHTQSFEEVMKLDWISNGYKSDYIHPRFVAELIRLGDLLDLDNGRFSDYVEKVTGEMPHLSKLHKEKHRATSHILITPTDIEIRIDCSEYPVYREARNWISWLEDEIRNMTLMLTDIIPKNFDWYVPRLTKKELLIKGEPDLHNLSDLKFQISQKKAFEIIEGSNLYEEKLVFIREFIQNALDASKIQLWRDLNEGLYESWIVDESLENLTPYDIDKKIYENYKLEITIDSSKTGYVNLSIKDRGTGISIDRLKKMCNVANSYSGDILLKQEILRMPSWLRPTGGFGIGMQSGFLVDKTFEAYTKTVDQSTLEINFESVKSEGYINVRNSDKEIKRGTEINIRIPDTLGWQSSYYINRNQLSTLNLDPMLKNNNTVNYILDYLSDNISSTLFPIEVNIEKEKTYINNLLVNKKEWRYDNQTYLYSLKEDLSGIYLWEKENSVYMELTLENRERWSFNNRERTNIFFKGFKVNTKSINEGISLNYIDIYGFNTKETLKLDRNSFTKIGIKKLNKIIKESAQFYINLLRNELDKIIDDANFDKEINVDVRRFIIAHVKQYPSDDFNPAKYKEIIVEDSLLSYSHQNRVLVLVKDREQKKFIETKLTINEIIDVYPNLSFIKIPSIRSFESIVQITNHNFDKIECDKLLLIRGADIEQLVDTTFISEINNIYDDNKSICIYTININNTTKRIKTDRVIRENNISSLIFKKNNIGRIGPDRVAIPVPERYEELVIKNIPSNILKYGVGNSVVKNFVVSPLTVHTKIDKFKNSSCFIKYIIDKDDYKNLINYVYENQINDKKITKERISELYEELIKEYYDLESK